MSTMNGSSSRNDSYIQEQIRALQVQGDYYARKVEIEKRRGEELDQQLKHYRTTHNETKKLISQNGGINTPLKSIQTESSIDQRSIRTLENRLEKVLIRYNEACNANKKLRDEIQNLRREKVQQQQIHEKLDRELHGKQQEVLKTSQLTQGIYDSRDRAQRQIETLRLQHSEETIHFESEWNELKEMIEMDRMYYRQSQHHGSVSINENEKNIETSLIDIKLRDETLKTTWLLSEKEIDLKKQIERLKTYEDGLIKIRKKTGIKDINELATCLIQSEEKNFSLFNMINQLNTEMELIEIENNRFLQLILLCQGSCSDINRLKIKTTLEEQIEKSKQKATHFETKVTNNMEIIDSIKSGAMNIFHKIGYNDEVLIQQLNSTGLTDINMLKFLGIIEKRIGEIVQMHNIVYTQNSTNKMDYIETIKQHKKTTNEILLNPFPPGPDDFIEDENELIDDDIKPCTIAEIQERTANTIGRRPRENKTTKINKHILK